MEDSSSTCFSGAVKCEPRLVWYDMVRTIQYHNIPLLVDLANASLVCIRRHDLKKPSIY